ncbi:MAG: PDZ domain-containing protein [Planctomycetes bacterium]|nr:PDZ domain-containing protein [Planctomycetota bacterium]MBL7042208.1 PDZ domain-containing protein [Pirellulaceae bacterium]
MARLFGAIIVMVAGATLSAAEKPAPPTGKAGSDITKEQIKKWVADLDSDRFFDREVATERLIAAGATAVEPVAEAVSSNNLEVTTRGMYILQELALDVNSESAEVACAALEKIAEFRGTTAARRAAATLAKLGEIRHDRALDELKRLGANVGSYAPQFGIPMVGRRSIEFGEKWRGEDKDLARLRWLRGVNDLIFQGPQVNDQWLKHVPKLTGLSSLLIKRASVTDEGIKHLKGMKGLQAIALMYLDITDQSVQTLKEFQGIGEVQIYGTGMTPAGRDELARALVGANVDYRQGGFLGVGCPPGQQPCVIQRVTANSAAEKAGMMLEDVIDEYDGKKVIDFEGLRAMIAKNRPGDKVTIKITRNGQKLTKELTLGEW